MAGGSDERPGKRGCGRRRHGKRGHQQRALGGGVRHQRGGGREGHTKQWYPLGIIVNDAGKRFFDEGADFRNYTYARLGAAIIEQPDAVAFQIFEAKTVPLLRSEEYEVPGIIRHEADDLGTLAQMAGIDSDGLERTVRGFNAAVPTG